MPIRNRFLAAAVSLLLAGCAAAAPVAEPTPSAPSTSPAASPATTAPAVFDALQEFWRAAYPAAFATPWAELRGGIHPLDSTAASGSALCISTPAQISGNAYYCPDADGIVYDTGVLVPVLSDHYGAAGLTASLAHEFGHAVAARAGVAIGSTLVKELQVDCFAGNFLVEDLAADQLVAALAPLLDFADQPSVATTDANAHGLAVDRAQAVQLGLGGDPTVCRDLSAGSLKIGLGTADPDSTTREGLTAAAAATWSQVADGAARTAGCTLGRSVADSFPDDALNYLRSRPGVGIDAVLGFLDGYAGRC